MALLKLAIPVAGATLDSGLEFQRGNSEISLAVNDLGVYGAKAFYRFDESSWSGVANEVADSSGNSYHGTAKGGATTGVGYIVRAGVFDGVDDYIQFGDIWNSTAWNSNKISVSLWINPDSASLSGYRCLVCDGGYGRGWEICLDGGVIYLSVRDGTAGLKEISYTPSLTAGNWYHLAGTIDGGNQSLELYLNGTKVASNYSLGTFTDFNGGDGASIANSDGGLGCQSPHVGTATCGYFAGKIDQVRVFGDVLTSTQVSALYGEYGYSTTSPTATLLKVGGISNTTFKWSTLANRENLGGETGSLKYQKAVFNQADESDLVWNGTWLTLAQIQALVDEVGTYAKLRSQHISDGAQDASLSDLSIDVDVPTSGSSGGISKSRLINTGGF